MTSVDSLVTVAVAVVSSGGLWGFLQFVVGRKSEAARQVAAKETADIDRKQLLADAQETAQRTALDSANKAYEQVSQRCDKCYDELHVLRGVTDNLIDSFETYLAEPPTPESRKAARLSIRATRQAL